MRSQRSVQSQTRSPVSEYSTSGRGKKEPTKCPEIKCPKIAGRFQRLLTNQMMAGNADIEFKKGQVYAKVFDDIYYSREDGPAESAYVFLESNALPQKWQNKTQFCIAETGFGTGLNFLVTAQTWLDDPARSQSLDYFSIEAFPIRSSQLEAIHAQWPAFNGLSKSLLAQYPLLTSGCHTLSFNDGQLRLHLIFEELSDALDHYRIDANCWYLDGFAPAKNPGMWHKDKLQKIGELSAPGTQFATFTAAGQVRRNLMKAGFEVSKRTGFGQKREMLCGIKSQPRPTQNQFKNAPWFSLPNITNHPGKVTVIGAGIAGAQVAFHLAQRGIKVRVIEAQSQIAMGASGNVAGVLAPRMTAQASDGEAFYLAAFLYQLNQIQSLKEQGHAIDFIQNGLLQLGHKPTMQQRIAKLAVRQDLPAKLLEIIDSVQATVLLGEQIEYCAMHTKLAGSLSPASLCRALLTHPNIELKLKSKVTDIALKHGRRTLIINNDNEVSTDALVIASGYQANLFSDGLDITPARGQSSSARLSAGQSINHTLGHTGYVAHTLQDQQKIIFGASYQRGESAKDYRPEDTQANLADLQKHLPELASQLTEITDSHVGIRATTRDRWPIVGPIADIKYYRDHYADLSKGKHYKEYPPAQYVKGVYVLSGLGSRGLTSAAYCANILVNMMIGVTPPAPVHQLNALHPGRFEIRALKKKSN